MCGDPGCKTVQCVAQLCTQSLVARQSCKQPLLGDSFVPRAGLLDFRKEILGASARLFFVKAGLACGQCCH